LNILESVKLHSPGTKVFLSGSAMQFKNKGVPIDEQTPFDASSPYSVARIHSIYSGRYFRNSFGLKVYAGYFFNHDSPLRTEQHLNQKIAATAKRVAKGSQEKLEIGNIEVQKEFNFAGDIVEAIWALVNQEQIFEAVIGSGEAHSIREWIEYCFKKVGLKWQDFVIPNKNFIPEYEILVSNPKLIKSIGWKPKNSFNPHRSMRFLVVLTSYPFPPRTGNTILAYNSIKHLSRDHEIDCICLESEKYSHNEVEFVKKLVLIPHRQTPKYLLRITSKIYMLLGIPPSVYLYSSRKMRDKVSEMIDTGKYDAILLFEMNTIQYCPTYSYKYIIVNIEDPQSIKIMRMASLKVWSFLQRIKLLLFGKITESYEKKILPKMAKVLLLSESDIQDFKKQYNYKNLGFVSFLFHPPNVDGALFFLQQIFPLVRQKYNSAKLWIVGADPDIRIYEAAKCFGKNVVITGRVNDISEYLRISIVSICTVRLKIGVQTKILEALSWGTPVVTLSAGNSGIGAIPGQELFVEDNPKHFAARITELLRGENWNQLSDKGRTFVETQFSWEKSVEQLNKYIEQQKN